MTSDLLSQLRAERAQISAAMSAYAARNGQRGHDDPHSPARVEFDRNARRLADLDAETTLARRGALPSGGTRMPYVDPELPGRLRAEREQLVTDLAPLVNRSGYPRGDLNTEQRSRFDTATTRIDEIDARMAEIQAEAKRAADTKAAFSDLTSRPRMARRGTRPGDPDAEREVENQFRAAVLDRDPRPITLHWESARSGYQPGVERRDLERRDLVTTTGSGMTGVTFYNRLVEHIVDNSAILAAGATLLTTDTGESLSVPKSTALSTAAIVTEGSAIGESDPGLGKVTLGAYKYGVLIQVSYELVEDVTWDLLGYLARETGIAIGNGAGAHFVTGTGSSQPSGVAGAASVGVTGATGVTGAFTADNLIDLAHSLAEGYSRSPSAAWLMRQSTLGAVRKLKGSDGQYIFSTDVIPGSGSAGTLLGRPVFCDPNVAAVGLNAKSVLFGDFSRYWVRQVNGVRFERSDEYAFNQDLVTFRALWRADGAMIDTTGAVKAFQGGAS